MAKADILFEFILSCEGGYSNHPNDSGGPTNKGVTLKTLQSLNKDIDKDGDVDIEDLKLLSDQDVYNIFKKEYWDKCSADNIKSQSVANLLVDWAYNSGVRTAIKNIQEMLRIPNDGILGPLTLQAINNVDSKILFNSLKLAREEFYKACVRKAPKNKVFYNGWIRRLNSFQYCILKHFDNKVTLFKDDGSRV
jgi:lysozyme family protein